MPWKPSYTREEAAEAIARSTSWSEALRHLGISQYGKNNTTLRKWAAAWDIPTDHLPAYRPRRSAPRFSEAEARDAIARSRSWTEALRRLGYCTTGGNSGTLQAWARRWEIATDHFDPWAANRDALRRSNQPIPLRDVLVENSTYSRSNLKRRLLKEALKQPVCELCGQGEIWRGKRMGLILDHVNGIRNDNRIENLRIVCPNCAATLETHCGRQVRSIPDLRSCVRCGVAFRPRYKDHRYCSRTCGSRWDRAALARSGRRKVGRPAYEQLLAEIKALGYREVGRRYGVSDNAVRKWIRSYERERALAEGRNPEVVEIPKRTWPSRRGREVA